jgi:hypothetical protein
VSRLLTAAVAAAVLLGPSLLPAGSAEAAADSAVRSWGTFHAGDNISVWGGAASVAAHGSRVVQVTGSLSIASRLACGWARFRWKKAHGGYAYHTQHKCGGTGRINFKTTRVATVQVCVRSGGTRFAPGWCSEGQWKAQVVWR